MLNYHQFFSPHSDDLAEQLWQASYHGRHSEVLDLLQRGAPPDSDYYNKEHGGQSPLFAACWGNPPFSAEYLIKWGANVSFTTEDGFTPLMTASCWHNTDCVKLLLDYHSPTGESVYVCVATGSYVQ